MNKNSWSQGDRNEFEVLADRCLTEAAISDRIDEFLYYLDGAVQVRRFWALDVNADIRDEGAARILKNEMALRRPRVPVAHDGQILGRVPREIGRKVRGDDGKVVHVREQFELFTYEDLRTKHRHFATTERAAAVDRYAIEKLLTLEARVPKSATPADACRVLGITVEAFLAGEEVA